MKKEVALYTPTAIRQPHDAEDRMLTLILATGMVFSRLEPLRTPPTTAEAAAQRTPAPPIKIRSRPRNRVLFQWDRLDRTPVRR